MSTVYFYSGVGGFFAGSAFCLLGLPGWPTALLCFVLAAALLLVVSRARFRSVVLIAGIVVLLSTGFGSFRAGLTETAGTSQDFAVAVGEAVTATGTIVSRPAETKNGQSFTVRIDQLQVSEADKTVPGSAKSVVYAGQFPELFYGDKIRLSGQLQKPEQFAGTGGRTFYYPQYLARKDIFYELSQPHVKKVAVNQGNWLQQTLANLRTQLLTSIHRYIPDPHAALTGGVLLGAEDALGEKLQEDFRQTSLIHIVVLSGFNVMIVATAIGQGLLAVGLPLVVSTVAAVLGIIMFALLVGLTPTVVRASIMAVFALLARFSGRRYGAFRGLSLAAVGMVLVTPEILLFDPSFQLSAIATAGLIGFGDQVEVCLTWLPEQFGIREAATATIAAQIAVLPLLLYYTGLLSFVSLPANLLVLPIVPLLMAAGALTILFGFISRALALVSAASVYLIADYIFAVVQNLSELSFATVVIPPIPIWLVIGVYAGLFWLALRLQGGQTTTQSLPESIS